MKILVATEKPFAAVAVEGIRKEVEQAGHELVLLEKGTKDDLVKAVADVDGLIVRSDIVDTTVLDAAKNLKVIVRAGAGVDNIDLQAAKAAGICVMNTPGQNSNAVAELVFGMLVMMIRNQFNGTSGTELKGKTLGIHAYGQVGRNVARIAKGFGMEVSALDPFVTDEVMEADGIKPVHSIEELYANNQYVSLHIPATPQTKGSVGLEQIKLMPKNAVLINTARKEIINEESLAEALRQRADVRYIADVKPDTAAAMAEEFGTRVFFTPKKMGAQTAEANINAGLAPVGSVSQRRLEQIPGKQIILFFSFTQKRSEGLSSGRFLCATPCFCIFCIQQLLLPLQMAYRQINCKQSKECFNLSIGFLKCRKYSPYLHFVLTTELNLKDQRL